MSRIRLSMWLGIACIAAPAGVSGQVTITPTASYHQDFDFGVGAQASIPLEDWYPNLSGYAELGYFFPDSGVRGVDLTYVEINAGLRLPFPADGRSVTPFALAGVHVARVSASAGGESAAADGNGITVGGGLQLGGTSSSVRPEVGARFEIGGGEGFVLFGGIAFPVG